jgi:hypothetical protein
MLMVRHPNRACESRALVARMLATLCPSLMVTPATRAGDIHAARAVRNPLVRLRLRKGGAR